LIISTYAVVLFTLLVQGLSLRWLLRGVLGKQPGKELLPVEPEGTALIEEGPTG
jgi:hypothetical protein